MDLLRRLGSSFLSVLPIALLGTALHLASPFPEGVYQDFLLASVLAAAGLALLLLGIDMALIGAGERIGAALMGRRSLALLLAAGFILGFAVTFAEPNAKVLSLQIVRAAPAVRPLATLLALSIGVGTAMLLAFLRLVAGVPYKAAMLACYIGVFALGLLGPRLFAPMGFDAGGTTTGPLAVPFVMALGIGCSKAKEGARESDSFGFVGFQTVGAVIAVLLVGLISPAPEGGAASFVYESGAFWENLKGGFATMSVSIAPLALILLLFQLFSLKLPSTEFLRIVVGLLYALVGMSVFLAGAQGGLMPTAFLAGTRLAQGPVAGLVLWALALGASVAAAEPSVAVLVGQVDELTGGTVSRRLMKLFIASGVALSLALVVLKAALGFSIMWILVPGYVLVFVLMFAGPELFGALAFDSGGVAAGPVAAAFILPFFIGVGLETGSDLFGAIGCISMAPVLTVQVMGLVYKKKGGAV